MSARIDTNTPKLDSTDALFHASEVMAPVTMSPTEMVALCEMGMEGFDAEISRKTGKQRTATDALKVLTSLKAKMAKFQKGLERGNSDGKKGADEKRGGGDVDRGRAMRGQDFDDLRAAYERAKADLPPALQQVASTCLSTMEEKQLRAFDEDQAGRMSETIEAAISDLQTQQQVEMAEINNLMSKRSNMIEMTKNIATALNGQQEFISRNAPR